MKKVFKERIFQVVKHFLYIKEMLVLNLSEGKRFYKVAPPPPTSNKRGKGVRERPNNLGPIRKATLNILVFL
jgi:hypothetical protein